MKHCDQSPSPPSLPCVHSSRSATLQTSRESGAQTVFRPAGPVDSARPWSRTPYSNPLCNQPVLTLSSWCPPSHPVTRFRRFSFLIDTTCNLSIFRHPLSPKLCFDCDTLSIHEQGLLNLFQPFYAAAGHHCTRCTTLRRHASLGRHHRPAAHSRSDCTCSGQQRT